MGFFHCRCLNCNHTGTVDVPFGKSVSNLICSRCKSKNIEIFENTEKHNNITKDRYDSTLYAPDDDYAYERREQEIFEEERQLDGLMMAPTGWEDDKEIQDYIGYASEPNSVKEQHTYINNKDGHIPCDYPGCTHVGSYRVPKTHDLKEYWHFCKDHITHAKTVIKCDYPGCNNAGTCRAPKTRDLKEYWLFCTEHAKSYNEHWNYYANMSPEEIEAEWKQEVSFGTTLKKA